MIWICNVETRLKLIVYRCAAFLTLRFLFFYTKMHLWSLSGTLINDRVGIWIFEQLFADVLRSCNTNFAQERL